MFLDSSYDRRRRRRDREKEKVSEVERLAEIERKKTAGDRQVRILIRDWLTQNNAAL